MTVMGKVEKRVNKSKMSKSHKKNQKSGKKDKKEFKSIGKRGRLVVRNLPFKCNENELHKHFKTFGEVIDIQLLRRPDKKLVGCGFVEYNSRLSAANAIEALNGKPFLGRPIYIERAVARDVYDDSAKDNNKFIKSKEHNEEESKNSDLDENKIKDEPMLDEDEEDLDNDTIKIKKEELNSEEEEENGSRRGTFQNDTKDKKHSKNLKMARLIVRNLSFKSTEDTLMAHFAQFGKVTEVKLLRRADNSLVGCGFVQFDNKQSAAKAIHHASGKPFLNRPIIVDWALAKDKFKKIQEDALQKEIKKEDSSDDVAPAQDIKKEKQEEDSETESESEEEEAESEEEGDDDSDEEEEDSKPIKQEAEEFKRHRKEDVDEGKTVFIKNLPFSVTDTELRECMQQYGPVYYALVCKDKLTDHSKGSGFIKFKNKEDAEKCLSAGTELTLKGTVLDPHPALKRNDVMKLKDKAKEKKDNRNLYLVKEGMIIAGTPAAQGVSVTDMERRLQLEQSKTAKLRNLNMFVSQNRLVIHNLPPTFSDKQLAKLFQKHAGPKAVLQEARVMRNLKRVDTKGVGLSKGYGFVSFEKHEDALRALRSINNNPEIFTSAQRPIVSFSIENQSVLNTKTKRKIRSRQKNPLCKDYKPEDEEVPSKKVKHDNNQKHEEESEPQYAGMAAKPGATVKMRQKYKLQNQAQQHLQDVRKQKREMKMSRKMRRTEHIKLKQVEKKSTKNKKKMADNDTAFTTLVDKYKTKILSQDKKKWYDD